MLTINFFASIREQLGKDSEALELPTDVRNVDQLIEILIAGNGQGWSILRDQSKVLVAVDQTIVDRNHMLEGAEEVAFFPPMTGG